MPSNPIPSIQALCDAATPGPIAFGDARIPESVWIRTVRGDSCWFWTGAIDGTGYGRMKVKGKNIGTHRFVLACLGIETAGLQVMHSCDRPNCVNPNHLSVGTAFNNQQDSVNKQRHSCTKRTHCPAGHAYAEHGVTRSGKRYCKICQSEASKRWQRKQKERAV